jgi:V-type H+-transporting ATPase subunit a
MLMGFFAAFCGFIYNDFMSIPLFIFNSCYPILTTKENMVTDPAHPIEMVQAADCVYPIGVDPAWYMSINELGFLNSLKMKISVILGVM